MGSVLEARFKKRFLDTPLIKRTNGNISKCNQHWIWCVRKVMPYATFQKGPKYVEYSCDLIPLNDNGLYLPEEGCQQIKGVFEAFMARWRIDKSISKQKQRMLLFYGPVSIYIKPLPKGEEVYIHQAVCQVLYRTVNFRDDLSDPLRAELIEKFRELVRSEKGGELKFV
jgi:hypothetical protein